VLVLILVLVLVLSLGSEHGELLEDEFQLGSAVLDLGLQVEDVAVAASDRVRGAHVGLVDDGSHGLVLVAGADNLDDFGDVAYSEEFVGVEELALSVVREIGRENAVGGAFSALVLACSASLSGAVAISCCGDSVVGFGVGVGVVGGGNGGGVVIVVHGLLGRNKKRGVRFRLHLRRGRCSEKGPFLGLSFSLPLFSRLLFDQNNGRWREMKGKDR